MTGQLTENNITFGASYKDIATGFTGVATAKAVYAQGTVDVQLEALSHDGKSIIKEWFDVRRLEFATN